MKRKGPDTAFLGFVVKVTAQVAHVILAADGLPPGAYTRLPLKVQPKGCSSRNACTPPRLLPCRLLFVFQ
jgi:hypothetical protein